MGLRGKPSQIESSSISGGSSKHYFGGITAPPLVLPHSIIEHYYEFYGSKCTISAGNFTVGPLVQRSHVV